MYKVMGAAIVFAVLSLLMLSFASAAEREATIIAIEGQFMGAGEWPITAVNAPFTDGLGQPGFTGMADVGGNTESFVWINDSVVLRSGQVVSHTLTNFESTMGLANNGDFIFSPAANGLDAVWTQAGLLLIRGQQAPGLSTGTLITFASRPDMLPNGTAYWISGFDNSGDLTTLGRVLYKCLDVSNPATIQKVLAAGDLAGGFAVASGAGMGFDFNVSDNDLHRIHALRLVTGNTANDDVIIVNNAIVAREGSLASASAGNWQNFDLVSINNNGDYIFTGDTDAVVGVDEFLAYNSAIAVRIGDILDGITLVPESTILAASINNQGIVAHVWREDGSTTKHLFISAAGLWEYSKLLFSTGDTIDTSGDAAADYTVTDIIASTAQPALHLAEDGRILIKVLLESIPPSGPARQAIIAVPAPASIELAMTVKQMQEGDDCGATCGTLSSIDIFSGDEVALCYTVTNTGVIPVNRHTLTDSVQGGILNNLPYTLTPGASAFLSMCQSPTESTTFTGEWVASLAEGGLMITATDSVTVNVIEPVASIELTMTVRKMEEGDECGNICGTLSSIDIIAGDDVEICYEVRNTGNVDQTVHDLTDSVLGVILNDFSYTLSPGASAFITQCHSPTETTTYTGEWAASLTLGGDTVYGFDSVTVNILPETGNSWLTH